MASIKVVTDIPGPKSRELVRRRAAAVSAGAAYLTELGIAWGEGAAVVDLDGNRLLDFAGGIGVIADEVQAGMGRTGRLFSIDHSGVVPDLVVIRAGLYSNCVRFLPPLTTSDEQIDEALDVLGEAFASAVGQRGAA